jgi:adenylosuccinate synthase
MKEYDNLSDKGYPPVFYADPDCPITTFFDIEHNTSDESLRLNGTVGVGFGSTLQRQEDHYRLVLRDLSYPMVTRAKLIAIAGYYGRTINNETLGKIDKFISLSDQYLKKVTMMKPEKFSSEVIMGRTVVFESAQGVLLDMEHGFFPNVTRSNTTCKNALVLCKRMGINLNTVKIVHVTRTYHTRHGNGPFLEGTVELKNKETENNKWDLYQGEFRIAPLNMELLRYAKECDVRYWGHIPLKNSILFVTCCDQLEPSPELISFSESYPSSLFSYSDDAREKTISDIHHLNIM